jgi:hypothetical protein
MNMAQDFQKFSGDFGEYAWVVLFVESPIDEASQAYADITGRKISANLTVVSDESHLYPPNGCVVQVRDSDWLVIFHLVGQWSEFNATSLSKRLAARVLLFSAEDTSGAVDCRLYAPGSSMIRYQVAADADSENELYDEMSEYAEEAGIEFSRPTDATQIESYATLFESLGICPVEISLNSERTVIVDKPDANRILRVDLIAD